MARRRQLLQNAAVLVAAALGVAACASPEIPVVAAPATPMPTATPEATALPAAPTPTPAPFDGEPGITADVMRIGVIADVAGTVELGAENNLGAFEAIDAWAATVNATGGIAGGRTIEIVRFDSQVVRHREQIDLVCNSDIFALVGSAALDDGAGLDQLTAPDCSLPDFPAAASTVERLRSPGTFVSNPVTGQIWNAGWARWYSDTYPAAVDSAATVLFGFPAAQVNGERMIEAASAQGFEFVSRATADPSTDFSVEAADLIDEGARALVWRNSAFRLLDLMRELGSDRNQLRLIDCGQACYSRSWVDEAGRLGNGVSVWLPILPFEDAEFSRELARYLFALPTVHPDAVPTVVGVEAWAAGLLFQEAVDRSIGTDTAQYDPDSISRAGVIAAAETITAWDANGLHGVANPAEAVPSPCFTLLTLEDGVWGRTFPARRGVMNCRPENLVELRFTPDLDSTGEVTLSTEDEGDDIADDSLGGGESPTPEPEE